MRKKGRPTSLVHMVSLGYFYGNVQFYACYGAGVWRPSLSQHITLFNVARLPGRLSLLY